MKRIFLTSCGAFRLLAAFAFSVVVGVASFAVPSGVLAQSEEVQGERVPNEEVQGETGEALAARLAREAGPSKRLRAEAAFRWVARNVEYDSTLIVETGARGTFTVGQRPRQVLRSRRAVCLGYARLFVALAKEMGVDAEVVKGHASADGRYIDTTGLGHAWAAVKLPREEREGRETPVMLADPTWAASYPISSFEDRTEGAGMPYWLVRPKIFRVTHAPNDPAKAFL